MAATPENIDTNRVINNLEIEIINGILEYLRNGIFPNNNPDSYMNAYTLVHDLSNKGETQSESLFNYHNNKIQEYIEECSNILTKESKNQLIDSFIILTEKINFLIYWMNRIFSYLDRFYTKDKNKNTLSQNAISLYKKYFFDPIQSDIYIEVNKLIKEDRNCNIESRPKIKVILKILNDIDLPNPSIVKENNKILWGLKKETDTNNDTTYQDKWFSHFKNETSKFAKDKANADIHNMSAIEYILAQLKYIDEENIRETEYINVKYHHDINEINYSILIGERAEELSKMDTGINYMFDTKRNEDLKNTFKLFEYFPKSFDVITACFKSYIVKRGQEINQNKEVTKDPKKFIPQLISLKKEMDNLVVECFENNPNFQDKKNKAFSIFMTKEIYSKQLSNYTDFCMRNGFKGKSQEEIENTLNDIIGLYKCLNSKLVFQVETNKKMSDRLIKNVSLSTNAEKLFISKLKQESGVTFVSKMTEMMNDLEKNKKEIEAYKTSQSKGTPNGIKFNVQVISQSAWDISNKSMEKIEILPFLDCCLKDFEKFYLDKHSGQKLRWCLGLSKLDIQFLKLKNKNISISTLPQYLTLYHLEKHGSLTILKVSELLGCPVSTVLADIHGLVLNPSYNPQGQAEKGVIVGTFNITTKEFKETDIISINKNFTVARQKFNTMPLAVKKSAAEIKENELEEAQITKRYQDNILQATLTRIMKSRIGQTTTHVWLINEASKQIDLFRAQPQQIKENIEKLIERSIMKRADNDRTCYEYVA